MNKRVRASQPLSNLGRANSKEIDLGANESIEMEMESREEEEEGADAFNAAE